MKLLSLLVVASDMHMDPMAPIRQETKDNAAQFGVSQPQVK